MKKVVRDWSKSVDQIVISTWRADEAAAERVKNAFPGTSVQVTFADGLFEWAKKNCQRAGYENAQLRQAATTLAGILEASSNDDDLIFKVRTDQYVPNFVNSAEVVWTNFGPDFLLVPRFVPKQPNHFSDFYFAGRADLVSAFLGIQLKRTPMARDVHRAQFGAAILAKSLVQNAKLPRTVLCQLFPGVLGLLSRSRIASLTQIFASSLIPLPKDVWGNIIWRGKPFSQQRELLPSIFTETWIAPIKNQNARFSCVPASKGRLLRFAKGNHVLFLAFTEFSERAILAFGSIMGSARAWLPPRKD